MVLGGGAVSYERGTPVTVVASGEGASHMVSDASPETWLKPKPDPGLGCLFIFQIAVKRIARQTWTNGVSTGVGSRILGTVFALRLLCQYGSQWIKPPYTLHPSPYTLAKKSP